MFADLDPDDVDVPVDPNKMPKFLTKPSEFEAAIRDTVVLPCEVYNPSK